MYVGARELRVGDILTAGPCNVATTITKKTTHLVKRRHTIVPGWVRVETSDGLSRTFFADEEVRIRREE